MTLLPVERLTSSDPTLLVQAAKTAGDPFGDLMRALLQVPASAGNAFDQLFANATSRANSPAAVQAPPPPRADDDRGRVATSTSTDPPRAAAGPTPDKSAPDKSAADHSRKDSKTLAAGQAAATKSTDGTARTADSNDTGPATDAANETASGDATEKPSKSKTKEGDDDPTARALALQGLAQVPATPNSPVASAVLAALAGDSTTAPGAIAEVATAAAGGVARGLSKAGGSASGSGGQAAGASTAGAAGAQQTASHGAVQATPQTASTAGAAAKSPSGAAIQATVAPPDGTAFVSRPSSTLSGSSALVFGLDDAAKAGAAAATKPTDGAVPTQPSTDGGAAKGAQTAAGMSANASALVSSVQANASGAGNKFAAQPAQPAATVQDAPGPQTSAVQPIAPAAGLGTDARAGATAQTQTVNPPRAAAAPLPPADQVAVQITKAVADGLDRITMQLRPDHLGRIDIQLDVGSDGRVSAVIAAHRPDTLNLLQRDASALTRALQDAGLHADAGSLSFNLGGQNSGGSAPFAMADTSPAPTSPGAPILETSPVAVPLPASNAAAAGGVDIRV